MDPKNNPTPNWWDVEYPVKYPASSSVIAVPPFIAVILIISLLQILCTLKKEVG